MLKPLFSILVAITVLSALSKPVESFAAQETALTPGEVPLSISSPAEGERLVKPVISVSGATSPGAKVTVSGVAVTVDHTGAFSAQIPVPDEEGAIDLSITAVAGGKTRTIKRSVQYVPPLRIRIITPEMNQSFANAQIAVSGEVFPATATVTVMGKKANVSPSGGFSITVAVPDAPGPVEIVCKAVSGDHVRTVSRTISLKKASDSYAPALHPAVLPAISRQKTIQFSVVDRTVDDLLLFNRTVDGVAETDTGVPGTRFNLTLEEGIHRYTVWAADKSGNRTATLTGSIAFLSSATWNIRLVKPSGNSEIIRIPQQVSADEFAPSYSVRFTITNLPDDEPRLLKEVLVTNTADNNSQSEHNIVDLDFTFDFDLVPGRPNVFTVIVRDINDVQKTASFSIDLRK